jgi:lysyl-tRNA synthetase class 1
MNAMKGDWITRISDQIEQRVRRSKGEHAHIICESGISPSGPIHLGNLREIMTVHLVVEELKARGWNAEHVHIWDDFDRLRKVPAGVDPSFATYIGQPLSDIPDPFGEYDSYALRYMTQFTRGLEALQVYPRYVRQSQAYREGRYTEKVKQALVHRGEIFDILAEYQTAIQETAEERLARRAAYYPYRVYCERCHKDDTQITSYNEDTAFISYTCQSCQYSGGFSLDEKMEGKLVWKVDWPMRWNFYQVDFEPAGEDHSAPGSSFTVGLRILREIYQSPPIQYATYAFVGMDGRTKISSSVGTTATLASALNIIEPAILRWLYIRRANNQAFNIDFGQGLLRLYDEWDMLFKQVNTGKANEQNKKMYERATRTSHGEVAHTLKPVPFSLLTSLVDVTHGNIEQVTRIVAQSLKEPVEFVEPAELEPRLTCALEWVNNYLPDDERTAIQISFDAGAYERLAESQRKELQMLVEKLDNYWTLAGLTELMYNIPKLARGLPVDTPPDDELKQAQRAFFVAVYTLICGSDTGPRIPTLLLSLGKEKVKSLLSPEVGAVSA